MSFTHYKPSPSWLSIGIVTYKITYKITIPTLNSALEKMYNITHTYNSDLENNIRTWFSDFSSKYAQKIIENGGATFYTSITGVMDYSGIAIPVGNFIRYFAFSGSGAVRIINVNCGTNTVSSVFSIAATEV